MMQIFWPSGVQRMSLTTLLLRLLIISSNQVPLCIIHTMISPFWSLVVSFRYVEFHRTTSTLPSLSVRSSCCKTVVPLEGLVHAQIARRRNAFVLDAAAALEFQDFKQAVFASACDPSLL
jgi:hypothetical protein